MNLRKDHYSAVPLESFLPDVGDCTAAPVHPHSRADAARCGTSVQSFFPKLCEDCAVCVQKSGAERRTQSRQLPTVDPWARASMKTVAKPDRVL